MTSHRDAHSPHRDTAAYGETTADLDTTSHRDGAAGPDTTAQPEFAEHQAHSVSGAGTHDLMNRYRDTLIQTYGTPQRVLTAGKGAYVWDAEGNRYLDLLGGIAVNALGHGHPRVVAAVTQQLNTLGHISNLFVSEPQILAAEKLLSIAQAPTGSRVFFANSGAEANEAAFKLARLHGLPAHVAASAGLNDSEKTTETVGARDCIIALKGGFHGRTMGALALTAKERYRAPFEPLPAGVEWIEPGDIAALEAAVDHRCAAVILEPIQGEAGVHGLDAEYLRAVRAITARAGALFIADEVQSGIGRTGEWLATSALARAGVIPDALTLAKGLGSGFPIGALITMGPEVSDLFGPGHHGSTFGGNPVAAAAALATLNTIEEDQLLPHVQEMSALISEGLAKLEFVTEVRAYGLLIGFDVADIRAADVVQAGLDAGFILNATGEHTLRLAPPLILSRQQAESFLNALPQIYARAYTDNLAHTGASSSDHHTTDDALGSSR